MSKTAYTKPTVVRMGEITRKTEGFYTGTKMEVWSYRGVVGED